MRVLRPDGKGRRRWLTCVGLLVISFAEPASAELVLEKVVLVSRHGVRSPTGSAASLSQIASRAWPTWPVLPGHLTPRGEALAALMGGYYRKLYTARGLLTADPCPAPDAVFVRADVDQRTRLTGAGLLSGMYPGCDLKASHRPVDEPDPVFHPVQAGVCKIDPERGRASVMERAGGDLAKFVQSHRKSLQKMQSVLGCCARQLCTAGAKTCTLATLPSTLETRAKDGGISLSGPISIGSTAGEIFLLEYAQGFPQNGVAWGRASTPAAIRELLFFHRVQFDLIERTPYLAGRLGSALLQEVRGALRRTAEPAADVRSIVPAASKLAILVGHDTNIANLGGMLNLHWTLDGYRPDETPPAGALAFELLRDTASGRHFVRLMYYSQTLDQMRRMTPLDVDNPPATAAVAIPGCSDAEQGGACPWSDFDARVTRALDQDCVGATSQ
jgi:4-phytase / acid phosphatase